MALARCISGGLMVMLVACTITRQVSGFAFGVVGIGTRAAGKANVMNTDSRRSFSNSSTAARAQQGRETRMSREGAYGCGRDSTSSEIGLTLRQKAFLTEAGSGTEALGMRAFGGVDRRATGTCGRAGFGRPRTGSALMARGRGRDESAGGQFTKSVNPAVTGDLPVIAMEEDPTLAEVMTACAAADERKAERVTAVRVAELTAATEYMIIMEGNSRPQNQAIAQNIEDKMAEIHNRSPKTQGTPESGWILLDYGDIIVHVMTPKSRSYYDLDTFWSNGQPVSLEGVIKPNAAPVEAAVADEVDPFWS